MIIVVAIFITVTLLWYGLGRATGPGPINFLKYFDILILRLKKTISRLKNTILRLKRPFTKFLISTLMFESSYFKVEMRI